MPDGNDFWNPNGSTPANASRVPGWIRRLADFQRRQSTDYWRRQLTNPANISGPQLWSGGAPSTAGLTQQLMQNYWRSQLTNPANIWSPQQTAAQPGSGITNPGYWGAGNWWSENYGILPGGWYDDYNVPVYGSPGDFRYEDGTPVTEGRVTYIEDASPTAGPAWRERGLSRRGSTMWGPMLAQKAREALGHNAPTYMAPQWDLGEASSLNQALAGRGRGKDKRKAVKAATAPKRETGGPLTVGGTGGMATFNV